MRVKETIKGRDAGVGGRPGAGGEARMNSDRWINLIILIPVLLLSHDAPRAGAWIRRLPAGRSDGQDARAVSASTRSSTWIPLGTAMFVITYLFSGFVFGWAKPDPGLSVLLQEPAAGHGHRRGWPGRSPTSSSRSSSRSSSTGSHPSDRRQSARSTFLFLAFQVNIVLGIFNLIPIPPLDGSRVLGAFLPRNAYEQWVQRRPLRLHDRHRAHRHLPGPVRAASCDWAMIGLGQRLPHQLLSCERSTEARLP